MTRLLSSLRITILLLGTTVHRLFMIDSARWTVGSEQSFRIKIWTRCRRFTSSEKIETGTCSF